MGRCWLARSFQLSTWPTLILLLYRKIYLAFKTIDPNHTYASFFFFSPEKRERERETPAHTTLILFSCNHKMIG